MSDRETETETRVVYVPGGQNRYDYAHDVVVLDERLKDYPTAHDHIKRHELAHAHHAQPDNRGFVDYLRLEWQEDVDYYFSDTEEIDAVREYYATEKQLPTVTTAVKLSLANLLRECWNMVLGPLGSLYRWFNSWRSKTHA